MKDAVYKMIKKSKGEEKNATTSLGFHLEADRSRRGMSVFVSGIIGIGDFSNEQILLRSHGGRVNICGKRLDMVIYENQTVEISGRVEEISFKYGKN